MLSRNVYIAVFVSIFLLIPLGVFAEEDSAGICGDAATKLSDVIVDWHQMIKEVGAEAKNPSVIKMYSDHLANKLKSNFTSNCMKTWNVHQDVYICFAGVRSEIGAAMCMHPDVNKSKWEY